MRRPASSPDQIIALFLSAYRAGMFPMAEVPEHWPGEPVPTATSIGWYAPEPRAILPLDDGALHVGRTLARVLRRLPFALTSDAAFERVIRACARPGPTRGGIWLDETLIRCYTLLHQRGHAHSIEAWHPREPGVLLGGIYGVSIGGAFFAESMFTDVELAGDGASSVCLITLWRHLRACGYRLLDVQIANDHTRRFGVVDMPRVEYHSALAEAIDGPDRWRPLAPQA